MVNKKNMAEIPITQHCVFALFFDKDKNNEHIVIGEMSEVRKYIHGENETKIIADVIRPFGTFILELSKPIARKLADIKAALVSSTGRKKSPYFSQSKEILLELYNSDNLIYRFVALLIWQEYNKACKDKHFDLYTAIEDISLPLMFSLKNDIIEWQKDTPQEPLSHLSSEYFKYSPIVLYDKSKSMNEYYAADVSLLPLVIYYLKTIYGNDTYIQTCKLCKKLFRAKTVHIATFCSIECKREQARVNKRRFDEKAKETPHERQYKNEYMYWYNKVKKLQSDKTFDAERLKEIETVFSDFCKDALKNKVLVKSGKADSSQFCNWLLLQRNVIDDIMASLK